MGPSDQQTYPQAQPSALPSPPYQGENPLGRILREKGTEYLFPFGTEAIQKDPTSLRAMSDYAGATLALGMLLGGGRGAKERIEPLSSTSVQKRVSSPLDKLKHSDFSVAGYEPVEGMSGAHINENGVDVSIYHSKEHGYFPILRDFYGRGRDFELSTYKTLPETKNAIREAFKSRLPTPPEGMISGGAAVP